MRNALLLVFMFCFVCAFKTNAQTSWRDKIPNDVPVLELRVFDAAGKRSALYMGFHPDASYGYDYHLGESPIPPMPVQGAFDARFMDQPRKKRTPPGGCYIDIRRYSGEGQIDTFYVKAQPLHDNYPITIAWSKEQLRKLFAEAQLVYGTGSSTTAISMYEKHHVALGELDAQKVSIVTRLNEIHFDDETDDYLHNESNE